MQFPGISSMKTNLLSILAQCASPPSSFRHGLAEEFLDQVFYFCIGCRHHSLPAIEQFTSSEKEELQSNLLIAIPRLEANLQSQFSRLGGESVTGFRQVRSGLQFLQDDIVDRQSSAEVDIRMNDLLQSDFVKEIDRRLANWKEEEEWDPQYVYDLRFIPESHNWWLEDQREESRKKYGDG
ncbi:hypothetical protein WR25_11485 [Diploscapter pachys]|uniref:Uncharacterized protein n=1 Tax=Diploscapter pachys TaxID=2018661 RepID=A0A2A2JQ73_9BILA|nr:hypothetical protein WR25_11485 [Diploscapter pachys]